MIEAFFGPNPFTHDPAFRVYKRTELCVACWREQEGLDERKEPEDECFEDWPEDEDFEDWPEDEDCPDEEGWLRATSPSWISGGSS